MTTINPANFKGPHHLIKMHLSETIFSLFYYERRAMGGPLELAKVFISPVNYNKPFTVAIEQVLKECEHFTDIDLTNDKTTPEDDAIDRLEMLKKNINLN